MYYFQNNLAIMEQCSYKYVIYPGNNHQCIQACLRLRNVWENIPVDQLMQANFAWKNLNFSNQVYTDFQSILKEDKNRQILLNHFQHNQLITTKLGLVRSLKYYYSHENIHECNHVFETIPTSFIIQAHKQTPQQNDFKTRFNELTNQNYLKEKVPKKHCEHNVWFIKPQAQNQGRGIFLHNSMKEIQGFINSKPVGTSWLVQKAIQKPLLYQGRKFDIRVWVLVSPQFEIYYYTTPYMRTSSHIYQLTKFESSIHLTNNYQQKHQEQYSKYQKGNTIPLTILKEYFKKQLMPQGQAQSMYEQIIIRMKQIILDTLLSVRKLFLKTVRKKQFQLFGYDFIVDEDYRVWLLQINNNPYLGTPNEFIKCLVPEMVNQMFQIILDPLFPPHNYTPVKQKRFKMIYRQPTLYRISNYRGGSIQSKKKQLYPNQISERMNTSNIRGQSNQRKRRNSEAVQTFSNVGKPKFSTPVQTIKHLLNTYCFQDFGPFVVPVTFFLTSKKLSEETCENNLKNLRLVTQTRICQLLLETKFIDICKNILNSDTYPSSVKAQIINGYTNACKLPKQRLLIIKHIYPVIASLKFNNLQEEQQRELAASTAKLLVKLGGYIDRKYFIPGQTRDNQQVRQTFIKCKCLNTLLFIKNTHKIMVKQIDQFLQNFNEKDWKMHQLIANKQTDDLSHSLNLSSNDIVSNQKDNIIYSMTDIDGLSARVTRHNFPRIKNHNK